MKLGLSILKGSGCTTMVQLVDGSLGRTTGIIRGVKWTFGRKRSVEDSHRVDFHVMDDIPCSVILSKWLLLDHNVFLRYEDLFFDSPVTHDLREETVPVVKRVKHSKIAGITLDSIEEEAASQSEFEGKIPSVEQAVARRELPGRDTQPSLGVSHSCGGLTTNQCLGSGIRQILSRLHLICENIST